ncbi:hypothetical protein T492DRAFT_930023 [Pavlovales sp. CCMP2436]|nr:hypothetical protein T492DRAFT_930023 [Pavlovales sp. CCMP2436]
MVGLRSESGLVALALSLLLCVPGCGARAIRAARHPYSDLGLRHGHASRAGALFLPPRRARVQRADACVGAHMGEEAGGVEDSGAWDGEIDEMAHIGLGGDDDKATLSFFVPYTAVSAPPGFNCNDENLEELVEWDVDDEYETGESAPPLPSTAPGGSFTGAAFVADWGVDDEAHMVDDDDE